VASFVRLDDGTPLAADELRVRYRIRDGRPKFATNAFFFQEGDAELYDAARYGEFRVDDDGELLLTGLRGARSNDSVRPERQLADVVEMPPSTGITAPVRYAPARDAR
jgi:hypothetical protein